MTENFKRIRKEIRKELEDGRDDLDRLADETEYFGRGLALHNRLTELLNDLRDEIEGGPR